MPSHFPVAMPTLCTTTLEAPVSPWITETLDSLPEELLLLASGSTGLDNALSDIKFCSSWSVIFDDILPDKALDRAAGESPGMGEAKTGGFP